MHNRHATSGGGQGGHGPPRFWQIRRRRRAAAARRITTCPPRFLDFATCLKWVVHLYHIIYLLASSFFTKYICAYFKVPIHPLVKSHLLLIAISPQNITQNRKYFFRSEIFSTPVLTKRQNLVKTHAHTKMRAQIVLSFYRNIKVSKYSMTY